MERHVDIALRGMNETDTLGVDPAYATWIENLERDESGVWRPIAGLIDVADGWAGDGEVVSVVWFTPAQNQRFLVYEEVTSENETTLRWVDFTTDPATHRDIAVRRRRPARSGPSILLQIGRWLYHFNGLEAPVRWDGRFLDPMGFSGPPPSPRVVGVSEGFSHPDVANSALDGTAFKTDEQRGVGSQSGSRWTYAYGLTVVNTLGQESPMSGLVFAHGANSATNGRFGVRVKLPRQQDHILYVKVWRSTNLDGTGAENPDMYLLDTLMLGAEADYIDLAPDSELGILFVDDTVGPVPVGIQAAAFWKGRSWVAVGATLHFSAGQFHEAFPVGNYLVLGDGSGKIQSLHAIPAGLVVLMERGVYLVKGSEIEGFRVEMLSESDGCAAPRAVAFVAGLGLVFLSWDGPRLLRGTLEADQVTHVVPLPGIRKTWKFRVVGTSIQNAFVVHRPDVQEVWWMVPQLGETVPRLGLVFHYGDGPGTWSTRPSWSTYCATVYAGKSWWGIDGAVKLMSRYSWQDNQSSIPTDPEIALLAEDVESIGGGGGGVGPVTTVVGVYETGVFTDRRKMLVTGIELGGPVVGEKDGIDVQARMHPKPTFELTSDAKMLDTRWSEDESRALWGTGTWSDTEFWHDYEPGFMARSIRGRLTTQVQFRFASTEMRIQRLRLRLAEWDGEPDLLEPGMGRVAEG